MLSRRLNPAYYALIGTKVCTAHPLVYFTHSKVCPAANKQTGRCPGSKGSISKGSGCKGSGSGSPIQLIDMKRPEKSGPCRLGFIPEEWFKFFYSQTGVSGPYVFGIVLINYLVSKEIYIMEHEYYLGLSIGIVMYLVITRLGPGIGASLDKEVDDLEKELEKSRLDELAHYKKAVEEGKKSKWMAEGQKDLMDAKKENIAMQLEAVYRERMMHVYNSVRGRMDYHVKRARAENRIHQKWMVDWILSNVQKSITAEFKKQALNSAIKDLAAAAGKA